MKKIEFKTFSFSGINNKSEDYILCHRLSGKSLVAIQADRKGGLSYGAEAAKIISESILVTILDKIQECLPEDVLRLAFEVADSAIHQKCRELKCKMGAAVTVVLVIDDFLYYAWQGNVRLYKVSNGEPLLLTTDHIAAETEGTFLTRCINGKGYREEIVIKQAKLEQGDRIYICSDGYYQHINLNAIQSMEFASDGVFEDDASLIEVKTLD